MAIDSAQYVVLCLIAVAYGFTKTGILGLSTVLTPVMLVFFTPGQTLGIILPLLILGDFVTLYLLRKSVNARQALMAIPWGLAGVFAGWRFLAYAQAMPDGGGDAFLRRVIGCVLTLVVLAGLFLRFAEKRAATMKETAKEAANGTADESTDASAPELTGAKERKEGNENNGGPRITPFRFCLAASLAVFGGCITMIANNGGPAWIVYLMLFRLDKFHFLGTAAWIIFILNLAKLPFCISLGYTTLSTLHINLFMIPFLLAGLLAGRWTIVRIPQKIFDNLVQALALIGAAYLLLR